MKKDYLNLTKEVIDFIDKSPTAFQAVHNIACELENAGFQKLIEADEWNISPGGKYYVTRNMSSIIAFQMPESIKLRGYMMIASHSDSPNFKIKPNPEMTVDNEYLKLNIEKYGGMICSTWFDRPLSIAGRVLVKTETGVKSVLVDIQKSIAVIPSLAVHLSHEANNGCKHNVQKDMLPLLCGGDKEAFNKMLRQAVDSDEILGADLFLYNTQSGTTVGINDEYFSAPRIDNLECAYVSLKAFLSSAPSSCPKVYCVFDNEEVGSGTKQGAKSTFLYDTLYRISNGIGMTQTEFLRCLASSFMLSADNGHALHPNYEEKACPTNRPKLNGGVLIKYNAQQKYTTDAVSEAVFKQICREANVPYQEYTNRSDIPGGSTLGNLSGEHVSISSADIGFAQLAMHSCYETAGSLDTAYMLSAMQKFYETELTANKDGGFDIVFR